MNALPETVDIDEAAALMKAETDKVMELARCGDLPGAKIGKAWVFMREDVVEFVQKRIDDDTLRRRQESRPKPIGVLVSRPAHGRTRPRPSLPSLT